MKLKKVKNIDISGNPEKNENQSMWLFRKRKK